MEHFFRFTKQKILTGWISDSRVEHEEQWWQLVHLAYLQLWAAQVSMPVILAPTLGTPFTSEKRDDAVTGDGAKKLWRIIRQFGTPAAFTQTPGLFPGRPKGQVPALRTLKPANRFKQR